MSSSAMQDATQDTRHQDELAMLFSRNLRFDSSAPNALADAQNAYAAVSSPSPPPPSEPQPITYISQHYTHSAHVTPNPPSEFSPIRIDNSELEQMLLRNSIDPLLLVPAQVKLFKNADEGQRLRLLELWRISPPEEPRRISDETGETNLQLEEDLARLRFERSQETTGRATNEQSNEQYRWSDTDYSTKRHGLAPATSVSSHVLEATSSLDDLSRLAEPYILSGYEYLAKRDYEQNARSLGESKRYNQALDPAYNMSTGEQVWSKTGIQDLENQYGAFAQMRDYDEEEQPRMHGFAGLHAVDDEMVM